MLTADGASGDCYKEMETGHVEHLVPMISEAMARANVSFSDLTGVAATIGPGTFTGTRIGIATARSFALSLGCPLYGVTSLTAMARKAEAKLAGDAQGKIIAVVINARREQVYIQCFGDNVPEGFTQPQLVAPQDAASKLAGRNVIAVGSGGELLATTAKKYNANCEPMFKDLQPDTAFIRLHDLTRYQTLRPLYLRAPDAKPPSGSSIARA